MGQRPAEASYGEVFNVGSHEEISIRALAQRVKELTGSASPIVTIPYDEAYETGFEDMHRSVPDTSKLDAAIGWRQTIELDEILQDVIADERARQESGDGAVHVDRTVHAVVTRQAA
jgi:UDP-glucose 4-epimerase